MTHVEALPGRAAAFGELDAPLDERLREALRRAGIPRFYSHQARATNAARRGENVITVTSTASGKTLCYNVPVLDDLLRNPRHRALYLFPTKALAQDQLGKLNALRLPGLDAATFDGDTPREDRRNVKNRAGIVLANPDMLSVGILPCHGTWGTFLRNLKWVVVDEVHTYRGVFGSHVGNVFRRLRRLCEIYGAAPSFLFSSATIANPEELARNLTGLDVALVDEDGSPSGGRRFVLWNPPPIGDDNTARRSANVETTSLFSGLVREGIHTIAFARARQTAEIILRYTRGALQNEGLALADKVTSYRAGYLVEERRSIERRLFNGDLLGVVSTNALELGVDIGGLDACILNGFPGTVASTWQQAGRAGRGAEEGLAILVAQDNPLDQYLMNRPDYFFGRPHEHAIVDPGNLHILRGHLRAAAYEAPLSDADAKYFGLGMHMVVRELLESGALRAAGDRYVHAAGEYPAGDINLRSASGDAFQIVEAGQGRRMGTEQIEKVFHTLHPGAVYLHLGESFLVERLDIPAKTAWVARTDANYYTQPRETSTVAILSTEGSRQAGRVPSHFGPVRVTNAVLGYVRKQHFSDAILGMVELDLPPLDFDTEALWFILPRWAVDELTEEGVSIPAGLHAIEHAAIGLMPLYAMCDRNDIGGVSYAHHPEIGLPAVFIHDAHPGGVGIAERCFDMLEALLRSTRDHIAACPCRDGCPSCIQSPKCGNNNDTLDKDAALRILELMVGKAPAVRIENGG
jgi:DEAD/DEAH box helicase domain-containing protein